MDFVESTELLCPNKHMLKQHDAENYKCDTCGRRCIAGDTSWYCESCDYDVCEICEGKFETGKLIRECIEEKGDISDALRDYDKSDLEEFCSACFMDVRDVMKIKSRKRKVGIWLNKIKQYIPHEDITLRDALCEIQQNFDRGLIKLETAVIDMVTMVQPKFVSRLGTVRNTFDRARDLLLDIKKLRLPRILVIGNASAGKSSLMNLFLGADVLKIGPEAGVTTTICEIMYSEKRNVCTTTFEGKTEVHDIPESDDQLYKLLEPFTSATRRGGNQIIQFKNIKFGAPFDILKSGLSLLDTPGLNDSEKSDEYIQEVASRSFATIVVLPCGDAEVPLNVKKIIGTMKSQQGDDFNPMSIFFVVTKADKETEGDRAKILDTIEQSIRMLVGITENMFVVNMKEALEVRQFGMRSPKHTELILGLKDFFEGMLASYLNSGWQAAFEALSICSSVVNNRLNQKGMTLEQMKEQCELQQSALQIAKQKLAHAKERLTDLQADEVKIFAIRLESFVRCNKKKLTDDVWKYHPKHAIESDDDRQDYIQKIILHTAILDDSIQHAHNDAQKRICDAAAKHRAIIAGAVKSIDNAGYFQNLVVEVQSDAMLGIRGFVAAGLVGGVIGLSTALFYNGAQYLIKAYRCSDTMKLAKIIIDETSRDENKRATFLSEQLFAVIQKTISEILKKLQNSISSKQENLDNLKSASVITAKEVETLTEYKIGLADIEVQLQRIHYANLHPSELSSEELQISDVSLFEGNCVSVYVATSNPQKDSPRKHCLACSLPCVAPPESTRVCAKLFKDDFSFRKFMREEHELRRSCHQPGPLDYYGVVKRSEEIYLITEYPSGSLRDILTRGTSLKLQEVASHALQIAKSLKLMQQLQIQDKNELFLSHVQPHHLNAENIVVSESKQDSILKIGVFHDCEDMKHSVDEKPDIYNFGTIVWELCYGIQPGRVTIPSNVELACRVDWRAVKLIQTCRSSDESKPAQNISWNCVIKELVSMTDL